MFVRIMVLNKCVNDFEGLLNVILEKFIESYEKYVVNTILRSPSRAYFLDLLIKERYEPHDILLHLLVKTGFELGIITIPEFKISLGKPIDKCELGLPCDKKKKRIKSLKADVVFHIKPQVIGIGEIVSGMLHHGFSSELLYEYYKNILKRKKIDAEVTIRDKLLHLARYSSEVKFFIIIIFIGNEERFHLKKKRSEWINVWKKTVDILRNIKPARALFVRGIDNPKFEIYP